MSTSKQAAPWRRLFLSQVENMASPEFTLSTLRRAPAASSSPNVRRSSIYAAPPLYLPRARTCIFRGLWANLPVNPKNDAPLNPAGVWESDLLTLTTDARMDKMEELWEDGLDLDLRVKNRFSDPSSPTTAKVGEELWEEGLAKVRREQRGEKTETETETAEKGKEGKKNKLKGSGGGAPVEAVFWPREAGVQWRVRGRAYVLAPDIESSVEGREVMMLLRERMRKPALSKDDDRTAKGSETEWSFAREITAHFGNLSPMMRGSFRNPPPGRPVSQALEGEGLDLRLGQKVTDLEDPVARENFRVVVIVPDEVDQTDLSNPEKARRWIHTYIGYGRGERHGKVQGEWETVEVWP
ncbi:pyridoxamine 5'-phosphate oxidase-domain-containing protein [Poronia punctata]|nr:pyridoxamine 5'-phosphate oxidase-domain-containing protein [Poronia punctata]